MNPGFSSTPFSNKYTIENNLLFEKDNITINTSKNTELDKISTIIKNNNYKCIIETYSNIPTLSNDENFYLSVVQSNNLMMYLINTKQISADNIYSFGFGTNSKYQNYNKTEFIFFPKT